MWIWDEIEFTIPLERVIDKTVSGLEVGYVQKHFSCCYQTWAEVKMSRINWTYTSRACNRRGREGKGESQFQLNDNSQFLHLV